MILLEQIRGARAMLGLRQEDLAQKAGLSISTLNNVERGVQTDPKVSTVQAIQQALEAAGIEFVYSDKGYPGLFLKLKLTPVLKQSVLIVSDDVAQSNLYKSWLTRRKDKNYDVLFTHTLSDGAQLFSQQAPSCVLVHHSVQSQADLEFVQKMQQMEKPGSLVVIDAHAPPALGVSLKSVLKRQPLSAEALYAFVDRAADEE